MLFLIIVSLCIASGVLGEDCVFDIKSPNNPIVLDSDLNFITSYVLGKVHFSPGEAFYLKCPSATVSSIVADAGDLMVCIGGQMFFHIRLDEVLTFDKIACKDVLPPHTVRLGQHCLLEDLGNFTEVDVGIEVNGTFIRSYTVCFDNVHQVPFYAEFTKPRYDCDCADEYHLFVDAGGVYGVDPELLYEEAGEILGDLAGSDVGYLQLVPRRHFLNPVEWYPTFDYVNHVFTWESYSRFSPHRFCIDHMPEGSTVYNGVVGVAVGKNNASEYVELYLGNGTEPIPKWYWCVFYDTAPEVDGRFYVEFGSPFASFTEEEVVGWWDSELCAESTHVYEEEGNFFYGNCSFRGIINPLLGDFVGRKWPGALTVASTPATTAPPK